jgi:hypothetical protein
MNERPIKLIVSDDLQRSRLTVFFRLLLVLPHLVWFLLWGIAVYVVVIVNWFTTLIAGRSPDALHRFLAAFVRYQNHIYAYLFLIANPFPGFLGRPGSYPVDPVIEDSRPQNRWKVLFRIFLALPALLITGAYGSLLYVAGVLGWFASLFTARMPLGLRNAGALALRYGVQTSSYLLLLTDAYPYTGPTAPGPAVPEAAPASFPLPV